MSATCIVDSVVVPNTPETVAAGLRQIADRIEADELTLIGLWHTGFAGETDAVLQFVVEPAKAGRAAGGVE